MHIDEITRGCEKVLTLQKPEYFSRINFRKSLQILQNLDVLLKSYKTKYNRKRIFQPQLPRWIRAKNSSQKRQKKHQYFISYKKIFEKSHTSMWLGHRDSS